MKRCHRSIISEATLLSVFSTLTSAISNWKGNNQDGRKKNWFDFENEKIKLPGMKICRRGNRTGKDVSKINSISKRINSNDCESTESIWYFMKTSSDLMNDLSERCLLTKNWPLYVVGQFKHVRKRECSCLNKISNW